MKLVFHFGQQKAGSTALQNALHENRGILARHRVLYPSPKVPHTDHGALSRLIFEEDRWPRQISKRERNNPGKVEHQAKIILRQIDEARRRRNYDTVVLSSEYFFRKLTPENVTKISRLLVDGFDEVQFFCYIRHPAPRYLSSCLQRVLHASRIPRPAGGRFRAVLESYAAALPITVRAYDPVALTDGDITRDFISAALPELEGVELRPSPRDNNASLSPEIASILQDYRFAVYPDEDDMVYRSANRLRDELLRIAAEADLHRRAELKPAVARYIEEQSADELAWLAAEYGVTFPGYEPAPEDAETINPKKLRWIQHVARMNGRTKATLTSRLLHEHVTSAVPRGSSIETFLDKLRRRLRAALR